ncbi:hypothetical protein ILYODFUR_018901 [Ilyodon furcidens]|uniref:Uncharacterized protein n=1 Tax=Ilyodon furcidens TaxID=33524 RepID=A0ABV0SY89_9TELE
MVPLGPSQSRSWSRSHAHGTQKRSRRTERPPQQTPIRHSINRLVGRSVKSRQLLPRSEGLGCAFQGLKCIRVKRLSYPFNELGVPGRLPLRKEPQKKTLASSLKKALDRADWAGGASSLKRPRAVLISADNGSPAPP